MLVGISKTKNKETQAMIQIDDKELAKRGLAPKVRNVWSLVEE